MTYGCQMVTGLYFMKQQGLAHHDVSLENVAFATKTTVKIIDLGMVIHVPVYKEYRHHHSSSRLLPPLLYLTPQPPSGKPGYVAPEVNREGRDGGGEEGGRRKRRSGRGGCRSDVLVLLFA